MSTPEHPSEVEAAFTSPDEPVQPLHGFQGNRRRRETAGDYPCGLTLALSREAGARGNTIAKRVGKKLGWQVYDQELLEYIAQEGAFRDNLLAELPASALCWAEQRLSQLQEAGQISGQGDIFHLVKTILAVGSQGEAIILGRGAGWVLPRATTLNIRIIAPLQDRIAYMSQWLRLPLDQAAEQVRKRDEGRAQFIQTHFRSDPADLSQYDMILNSSLLGEDLTVDLIVHAAQNRWGAQEKSPPADASGPG
jgi:cytidylate kinase